MNLLFDKRSLWLFLTYFLALFSYPMVRSIVGASFYDAYSSDSYSLATFFGIIFLVLCILVSNKLQKKYSIQKVYLILSLGSSLLLSVFFALFHLGWSPSAFFLFAVKESYIVLLIHLCLALGNNMYSLDNVKKLYGPLGAAGSIGGIIGGWLTSYIATSYDPDYIFYLSIFFVGLTGFSFYQIPKLNFQKKEKTDKQAPLKSVKGAWPFVLLIGLVVTFSQWSIFLADLEFNMIFEKMVVEKASRTAYLGELYSKINMITLGIQFILLPFVFRHINQYVNFIIIPFLYLVLIFLGAQYGVHALWASSGIFIMMKAMDYSLFSYTKEVLYHGLKPMQKFGAKYITDMFTYRLAKALIAFVFSFYSLKESLYIFEIKIAFILGWITCVSILFINQKKVSKND